MTTDCIFCRIATGRLPARIVDEDRDHLAFLSLFPNTPGCTVVIPRAHAPSYFAACSSDVVRNLMVFAQGVATLLDQSFEDVGRTGLVFEGYGINHLHAKLFPLHGTPKPDKPWREIKSGVNWWSEKYQGYISSHDCDLCSDEQLDATHSEILRTKSLAAGASRPR